MNENTGSGRALPEQPTGPENIPVAKSFSLQPPRPVIPPRIPVEDLGENPPPVNRLRAA